MSGAPARGAAPRRQRRHHHHHHHHHHQHPKHERAADNAATREEPREEPQQDEEPEEKRPKVNPIFLWASQREQRIVEVRCEDYDKRNRIKLTKTAQGWRSIPRTASNMYSTGLGLLQQEKKTSSDCNGTSSATACSADARIEEKGKDVDKPPIRVSINSLRVGSSRKEVANRCVNGSVTARDSIGRKRKYEQADKHQDARRKYTFPVDDLRKAVRIEDNWEVEPRRVPYSEDDDDDDQEEDEDDDENADEDDDEENAHEEDEEDQEERESHVETTEGNNAEETRTSQFPKELSDCRINSGRRNLERLKENKLFQPRVVLEQLRLPCRSEGGQKSNTDRGKISSSKRKEDSPKGNETAALEQSKDNEKTAQINKTGSRDILNMIDATASPVLATDTPSANLPSPMDSTKTVELVLKENAIHHEQPEKNPKDSGTKVLTNEKEENSSLDYGRRNNSKNDNSMSDEYDKVDIHEEKILDACAVHLANEKAPVINDIVTVPLKNSNDVIACKVVEADGGLGNRHKSKSKPGATWQNNVAPSDTLPEAEEDVPDEPEQPMKLDYSDSSKILNALRNTPGLSVSVTRTHTPEATRNSTGSTARPSSKGSSSSRSPDSQADCVDKLLKVSSVDTVESRGRGSPRNLPGLSIIIPSYRYRNPAPTHSSSPNPKHRVESPESTVNFPKTETYTGETKLDTFTHEEEEEEEQEIEEDEEDDCDSQVLEDLRQQKADCLAYDGGSNDYQQRPISRSTQDDHRKTPQDISKGLNGVSPLWISSSRSSEAQAKCKYQDLEHFDEQVLEELRSRGTVVSPQPSGIPCSPASRRSSSAYLERLLPSPPCSVTCSEDAKNDVTLKGILSSPSRLDAREYDRQREALSNRSDQAPVAEQLRNPRIDLYAKDPEKSSTVRRVNRTFQDYLNVRAQEMRNATGRPMSSGDMHSTYYPASDRATLKRPMSAEWSMARHKSQSYGYQKSMSRSQRARQPQMSDHQENMCATSSTSDRLLDPASQLRELVETSGRLIPDPLLVPRDYLPALAAAPAIEIPKLLASRPELRLPVALTRPDLLRDPDLLVISLAHLQHVLDHGEGPVSRSRQFNPKARNGNVGNNNNGNCINNRVNGANRGLGLATNGSSRTPHARPKLSCKPIGTLMPAPIDLSSSRRASPYPPLLRVRSGLLKQESEVSSTASSPDDSQLWHPLFGSQKRQQQQQQQSQHASWHRTTLAS